MKIEYRINNITPKKKMLCIGDLIRYYGEVKFKIIESAERLNSSGTKGMVTNLLKKAINNPHVDLIMNNLTEIAQRDILKFTIDGLNLIPSVDVINAGNCVIVIEMDEAYFHSQAMFDMMKPGFRKRTYEDHVNNRKQDWMRWFEKNLKADYTEDYSRKILER